MIYSFLRSLISGQSEAIIDLVSAVTSSESWSFRRQSCLFKIKTIFKKQRSSQRLTNLSRCWILVQSQNSQFQISLMPIEIQARTKTGFLDSAPHLAETTTIKGQLMYLGLDSKFKKHEKCARL